MSQKPATGSLGVGPLSGVLDSMEFLRQAWSTFNLPTNLAPTMDLEEIDRRIADLRTVEQWLEVNLGMVRGAIQGMEIQRGTLAAIRAFGEAMAAPGEGDDAAVRTMAALGEMQRAATAAAQAAADAARRTVTGVVDAPSQPAPAAAGPGAAPAPASGTARTRARARAGGPARPDEAPRPADAGTKPSERATAGGPASLADEIARAATAAASPAAWWKLLQSQFGQVAQAALAGAGVTGAAPTRKPGAAPAKGPRKSASAAAAPEPTKPARGRRAGTGDGRKAASGGRASEGGGAGRPGRGKA